MLLILSRLDFAAARHIVSFVQSYTPIKLEILVLDSIV